MKSGIDNPEDFAPVKPPQDATIASFQDEKDGKIRKVVLPTT
jgi:hypothetical protein